MVKSKPSTTGASRIETFDEFDRRHGGDGIASTYKIDHEKRKELYAQGLNSTNALQHYIEDNGLYGTATVLEDADFDAYVEANGLKPIYRGMPDGENLTGVEKHENFLYDDKYYVGNGMFGDGQYFAYDRVEAEKYAVTGFHEGDGAVIKAALKPSAKTVRHDALLAEMAEKHRQYKYSESMLSVYARSQGYDAMTLGGMIVVLNRDALVVSGDIRRMRNYDYI